MTLRAVASRVLLVAVGVVLCLLVLVMIGRGPFDSSSNAAEAPASTPPPAETSRDTTAASAPTTPPVDTSPDGTAAPDPATPPATVPAGAAYAGTFDGNSGLDRLVYGVYHRGMGEQVAGQSAVLRGGNHTLWGDGSGTWTGDHGPDCGSPDTQRPLSSTKDGFNVDELVYLCRDHVMTSLGEVDGYSIVWFSPDGNSDGAADGFTDVTTVSWDVNVTDLGGRQWWEVMVIPVGGPTLTCIEWLPCDLPTDGYPNDAIVVSNRASGSPELTARGVSANLTGPGQDICVIDPEGCLSKPIRRTWTMTDNGNGTITVTFDRGTDVMQWVQPGSFASGAVKVVFKSHAYTPSKDPGPVVGNTWHWDNIIVE